MLANETEAVDRLMYRISHDLSASARALVELPKWISEDLAQAKIMLPEDIQENLDALGVNGRRLDRMVNDLMMYSRIGRFQQIETITAHDAISDVVEHLALPHKITLHKKLCTRPFQFSQPDFSRICQALLSNAVKHSGDLCENILVEIAIQDNQICLSVEDDGPGIPQEYLTRVREVFTTLRPRDEVEGTGMGLALVDRIVAFHTGTFELGTSRFGRGLKAKVVLGQAAQ